MNSGNRTSKRSRNRILLMLAGIASSGAMANDITGEDTFVCTAWRAVSCSTASDCENKEAWQLNIPDFVRVDLGEQTIGTLPGSEEERTSEVQSVFRQDGRVFLNGAQEDRGFTWVINESTGEGTLAIVTETTVISLFTACAATDHLR